jgi:hypothetical protein
MKRMCVARVLLWVSCLSATVCVAGGLEPEFHSPATVRSEQSADFVRRVQSTFVALYEACRRHDRAGVEAAMISDGAIEYGLEQSGAYIGVDVVALSDACTQQASEHGPIANLWVFPTADPDTAFVQYDFAADQNAGDPGSMHVALVEIRGNRISRFRDLSGTMVSGILPAAASGAT